MKINYTENEKRHIFESETGHVSTFLKERVTKKQAEALFQAQLANEGISGPTPPPAPPAETTAPEPETLDVISEEVSSEILTPVQDNA
jgi:hypothetical protein